MSLIVPSPSIELPPILLDVDQNAEGVMKSPVVKRSIVIAGHKTSVSLEDAFWKGLKEIATGARPDLVADGGRHRFRQRAQGNLSSALPAVRARSL